MFSLRYPSIFMIRSWGIWCIDMFIFSSTVCREIAAGCKVIFGPGTRVSSSHVQSMCKFLAIPHIQAHWDPRDVITDTKDPDKDHFSLNLYPYYLSLSTAFRNLIDYWKWTQFTVIYEDNDGKDSMEAQTPYLTIHVYYYSPPSSRFIFAPFALFVSGRI